MRTYWVYQYDAWGHAYRLVAVVAARCPRRAAVQAKIAAHICGALYVRTPNGPRAPREVPAGGWFAQTLTPY